MEEFRRHHYSCPLGRPAGVHRLDVFHDYGAFPVWGRFTAPPSRGRPERELHGALSPGHLGVSEGLAAGLRAWAEWRDAHSEWGGRRPATTAEREAHQERGRVLAERLRRETGAEVLFEWRWPDGDPDCPHCGERVRAHR
jgi:transposase-like zinc ribbon protein